MFGNTQDGNLVFTNSTVESVFIFIIYHNDPEIQERLWEYRLFNYTASKVLKVLSSIDSFK